MAKNPLDSEQLHKRYRPTVPDEELRRVTRSIDIPNKERYRKDKRKITDDLPNSNVLDELSKMQASNHQDYRSIIELLPELQRGMSILESAVLSPKDLLNPTLMFRMREDTVSDAASDVLTAIQSYLTTNYALSERLPQLLREALHSKGAYVLGVIPRNTLDALVQEGRENINMQSAGTVSGHHSFTIPQGLLALPVVKGNEVNMQSYGEIPLTAINENMLEVASISSLTITDNFNLLKLPRVAANQRRRTVMKAVRPMVGIAHPSNPKMLSAADTDAMTQLFKRRDYAVAEKISLVGPSGTNSEVYGRPSEMNFPMEACIPVHIGGDVSNKAGIILLTDETGSPVTAESTESQYRTLQSSMRNDSQNANSLTIERVQEALSGRQRSNLSSRSTLEDLHKSFNSLVMGDLVDRVREGIYGPEAGISNSDTVLDLAFKRLLCGRKTRMVFIPEEIVTYIAFDYDEFGIGRSRLESSKIIASMRAVLMYTNMNAAMTNAVPSLKLNIKLDEDDPDPEGTIDDTIAEFYALNSMRLKPGSTLNSHDITEMLQQMGVTISVEGNKRYPSMDVTLDDVARNKAVIDRDLDESLAKRIWLMMGLSPEAVDSSFDVEFARTIVSNNLFLAKLASEIQIKLLYQYSAHTRKLIYSDGNLMTTLIATVKERLKGKSDEDVLEHVNELVESFHLALPSTDIAKIESQQEALENYTNFVEGAIEAYVNEEMFDGVIDGELDEAVRPAIRAYRDMLIRDFMKRENILPELQAISNGEDDEIDLGERFGDHAEPIIKAMSGLLEKFRKKSRKFDRDEEKRIEDEERKIQEEQDALDAEQAALEGEDETLGDDDSTDIDVDVEEEVEGEQEETEETDGEVEEDAGDESEESGTEPEDDDTGQGGDDSDDFLGDLDTFQL